MAAPAPTQYTQQSIGFADQIAPYAEKLLGNAELYTDLNENPYQQYMKDFLGRDSKFGQRWHFKEQSSILFTIATEVSA